MSKIFYEPFKFADNKTALVTGVTGGIGKAIAANLINAGVTVIGTGRDSAKLDLLSQELGTNLKCLVFDFCNKDISSIKEMVDRAETIAECHIDILVANAGITHDKLSLRMNDADWNDVIELNLNSVFKLNRICAKSMMKAKWGRIINISSVIGYTGNIGQANYAASKAALVGMSKSLAQEYASYGVTVNCIAPGFINTNMTNHLSDEVKASINKRIPLARIGEPNEVSHAVVFLSSKYSSYITGSTIHINGGMYMA